jgi:prophage regulatory protein
MEAIVSTVPAAAPLCLLRRAEVMRRTSLSKAQLYALMKKDAFPKQITLSPGSVAWSEAAVQDWIARRIAASESGEAATDEAKQALLEQARRGAAISAARRRIVHGRAGMLSDDPPRKRSTARRKSKARDSAKRA